MKPDTYRRFAYIETRLYWGNGLTARELGDTFDLSRQTAQGVIDEYRRQHPNAMVFDPSRKRQVAGPAFTPRYIPKGANKFLDYQRGQAMMGYYLDQADWGGLPFFDVDRLFRPRLRHESVMQIASALLEERTVVIDYQSKSSRRVRDFSPHHLVFAGNRYHVRGYCHLKEKFLDFVLSRILYAEPSTAEWVSARDDIEWNTFAELHFKPNEKLPAEAIRALRSDYPVNKQGNLEIQCRNALAFYVRRELLAIDSSYKMPCWVAL